MIVDEPILTLLTQHHPSVKWKAWIESVAITCITLVLGLLINRSDPFLLKGQFSWLILPPLLISLQYGFRYGISTTSFFIAILAIGWHLEWKIVPEFPVVIVAGMLLVTMIAADYHNRWERQQNTLRQNYNYQNVRMEGFSRTYQALSLSHAHLEQQLVSQTKSLRSSLFELEKQIFTINQQSDHDANVNIGKSILSIFSGHVSIYAASLYSVSKQNGWKISPLASVGKPASIRKGNFLVKTALNSRSVASVQTQMKQADDALVVIPLVDVFDKIWGIVVVTEMPFFALNSNTLDMLAVIGGRIGDLLNRRVESQPSADVWEQLEGVLLRILIEVRKHKKSAVLSAIHFASAKGAHVFIPKLLSETRALDKVWIYQNPSVDQVVFQLLPLTDSKGADGLLQRLSCPVPVNGENSAENNNVRVHRWVLDADTSVDRVLSELSDHCQVV